MTYADLLKQQENIPLMALHRAATQSVIAWSKAVEDHGSLLQNWIQGQEVVTDQRYPLPDIVDRQRGYQFFYHAHRHGADEHGHLHLFYHATQSGRRRYVNNELHSWVKTAPSHLLAIGMDERGLPVSLFTVNQWITDGHWFDADTVMSMVQRFDMRIAGTYQHAAAWLTGLLGMYRPLILELLRTRDETLAKAGGQPELLLNHDLDVLSYLPLDWEYDINTLEQEVGLRGLPAS